MGESKSAYPELEPHASPEELAIAKACPNWEPEDVQLVLKQNNNSVSKALRTIKTWVDVSKKSESESSGSPRVVVREVGTPPAGATVAVLRDGICVRRSDAPEGYASLDDGPCARRDGPNDDSRDGPRRDDRGGPRRDDSRDDRRDVPANESRRGSGGSYARSGGRGCSSFFKRFSRGKTRFNSNSYSRTLLLVRVQDA